MFWIIGITFFILITSASNLAGCCRTQCENVLQLSDFFVFGTGDIIFYMRKMTKTFLKNPKIYFSTFQKICTIIL